jgi:hypothetical protein
MSLQYYYETNKEQVISPAPKFLVFFSNNFYEAQGKFGFGSGNLGSTWLIEAII